tara:strand:+ start:146 stop:703 length:558 start_codon:yes stop_codon:yes gene_type:complete
MAEGMFVRVTHAGASDGSLLISDINDATDGPIHGLTKAGAVYVPEGGSVELIYSGDVARSFEGGSLRKAIDGGLATASFERGDAVGQALSLQAGEGTTVACAALGKIIGISLVIGDGAEAGATLTIASDGADLVAADEANGAALGASALTLLAPASEVAAGDVITFAWANGGVAVPATIQITFAG